MATLTKIPYKYDYNNVPWSDTLKYLLDDDLSTYANDYSNKTAVVFLFYDFSQIPANATITQVITTIKFETQGVISYRLCRDATSTDNYTSLHDSPIVVYNNTTKAGRGTLSFNAPQTVITALNDDIGILRDNRFSLRLYNKREWYGYIHDVRITITYSSSYTISTSVSPAAGGTVSGAGSYSEGAEATLTATPASGYRFVKWQKNGSDDGNTSATREITVSEDATYTAVFEVANYTITFDASGGSVSTTSKTVTPGNAYGSLPTPTRAGYTFAGWYTQQPVYNGGFLRNNENIALGRTYMYTNKINVKIYAYMDNWNSIVNKNLISCTEGGGWGIGYLANTVGHGTEVYISGIGYKGIDFGIASLSSGWHCFDMVFDGSNLIGYVDGVQKGSVSTGGTSIAYHSSNGIFIGAEAGANATSGTGGYFNGSVGSVIIANVGSRLAEVTPETTVSDYSAHTLYAVWKINHYTTTATCSNGTINGTTSYSSVNPYGEQITLTASPATGYHFVSWNDGNTSASRTITVQSNGTYTANFALNSYSVSKTLSHATMSNSSTTVQYGDYYSSSIAIDNGYELDTVTVTMDGSDITSSAYSNGTIGIQYVTGNISITVTTTLIQLPEIDSVSIVPNPVNAGQGLVLTVVFT